MSEDRILSAFNASELTRGKGHDVDKANINKTIRETRKENRDEDRILKDFIFLFDPEEDHYKPVKTVSAFDMKALEMKLKIYQSKNILILSDDIHMI